jgi:thiol-disulfide isomerase/thioredoxin
MKLSLMSLLLTAALSLGYIHEGAANGIRFETNWNRAVERAKRENKMLFVDFYATWCGPCVYMSERVFTEQEVGRYFNQHYISVKIDAEKEEKALVDKIQLEAYPTLVFFDPNQEIVYKKVGSMSAPELISLGRQVKDFRSLGKNPDLKKMNQQELTAYLSMLKEQDFARASQIAEGLLKGISNQELGADFNLFLLTTFVHEPAHPRFQYLIANLSRFSKQEEIVSPYISTVLDTLMERAVKQRNTRLLEQYASIYHSYSQAFEEGGFDLEYARLRSKALYYMGLDNTTKGKDYYRQLVEGYHSSSAETLISALLTWLDQADSAEDKQVALRWAQKAYGLEKNFYTCYLLAHTLQEFDKVAALRYNREALELAYDDDTRGWARRQGTEIAEL